MCGVARSTRSPPLPSPLVPTAPQGYDSPSAPHPSRATLPCAPARRERTERTEERAERGQRKKREESEERRRDGERETETKGRARGGQFLAAAHRLRSQPHVQAVSSRECDPPRCPRKEYA